jgi:ribosomal protein RSM22 (predicted rRNA methylase)
VALVLIEPGTTRGFSLIREAREQLLACGAHLVAPCPHAGACQIAAPDWCHFAARVERSSLHRRLKSAQLSYEDEKFSYLVVSRSAVDLPSSRVIRRPQQQPGLIVLDACTPEGIQSLRISRKDPARFRAARRAAWGDPFPL